MPKALRKGLDVNPFQLTRCAFGKHHRDRSRVRRVGDDHYSVCTGCGARMVRGFHGWRLVDRDAFESAAASE